MEINATIAVVGAYSVGKTYLINTFRRDPIPFYSITSTELIEVVKGDVYSFKEGNGKLCIDKRLPINCTIYDFGGQRLEKELYYSEKEKLIEIIPSLNGVILVVDLTNLERSKEFGLNLVSEIVKAYNNIAGDVNSLSPILVYFSKKDLFEYYSEDFIIEEKNDFEGRVKDIFKEHGIKVYKNHLSGFFVGDVLGRDNIKPAVYYIYDNLIEVPFKSLPLFPFAKFYVKVLDKGPYKMFSNFFVEEILGQNLKGILSNLV